MGHLQTFEDNDENGMMVISIFDENLISQTNMIPFFLILGIIKVWIFKSKTKIICFSCFFLYIIKKKREISIGKIEGYKKIDERDTLSSYINLVVKKKTNKTPIGLTRFLKIINCYSILFDFF